jgi:Tfp pilus assembly protein PilV
MEIIWAGTSYAPFYEHGTLMKLSTNRGELGTSLIEATIAACTSAMFLGSLFAMNVTSMKTMRTAREAATASQVLQQRVETLRIANWHQITDADWLRANVLNTTPSGSTTLNSMSETLTLVPYGSASTNNTQLTRTGGNTQIVTNNNNMLTENAMKVIWTVAYSGGLKGDVVTRQTVAVLAKGGVAKW